MVPLRVAVPVAMGTLPSNISLAPGLCQICGMCSKNRVSVATITQTGAERVLSTLVGDKAGMTRSLAAAVVRNT